MYEESGNIKFGGSDDADLKSIEVGFNVLTGYEFKGGCMITANYNLGLNNISPPATHPFTTNILQ